MNHCYSTCCHQARPCRLPFIHYHVTKVSNATWQIRWLHRIAECALSHRGSWSCTATLWTTEYFRLRPSVLNYTWNLIPSVTEVKAYLEFSSPASLIPLPPHLKTSFNKNYWKKPLSILLLLDQNHWLSFYSSISGVFCILQRTGELVQALIRERTYFLDKKK